MNPDLLKFVGLAGLNGLWAALVFTGHTSPEPLVAAIGTQITALLGYHAVTNLQSVPRIPK